MVGKRCSLLFIAVVLFINITAEANASQSSRNKVASDEVQESQKKTQNGGNSQAELTPGVNCVRPCTSDTEPLTCYYEFNVEDYEVYGLACDLCQPNVTNYVTNDCQCVVADGLPRTAVTINRMLPGPAIYVCKGDRVVVDVVNLMEGSETTVHWHGITQKGTQYYDGVPYVTQCPIASGATFRYIWTADTTGTYFYHSHSGLQLYNGMAGSLVVYGDQDEDPNGDEYDVDSWETVMILQDWKHERAEQVFPGEYQNPDGQEPVTILINGMGVYNANSSTNGSYAQFNITQGLRYRFRMINAFASVCPVSVQVENHTMTVISTDGINVDPATFDSIVSMTGERYDFILNADQDVGSYWIQARGLGECEALEVFQLAILNYNGTDSELEDPPTAADPLPDGVVLNPVTYNYTDITQESVPVAQLVNSDKDISVVAGVVPNRTLYIPFGIYALDDEELEEELYTVGTYRRHSINTIANVPIVSNITFVSPVSPLLSQFNDVATDTLCDPSSCAEPSCACTNILKLELGEVVDIYLVDNSFVDDLFHPIHLHGFKYYVLDMGFAVDLNLTVISVDQVQSAVEAGALAGRIINDYPPGKDTIAVPTNGYAHIRIFADNPGFWFMHCHVDIHMSVGMNLVVQVGELSDLPDVPVGFPKCGNYLPTVDE